MRAGGRRGGGVTVRAAQGTYHILSYTLARASSCPVERVPTSVGAGPGRKAPPGIGIWTYWLPTRKGIWGGASSSTGEGGAARSISEQLRELLAKWLIYILTSAHCHDHNKDRGKH